MTRINSALAAMVLLAIPIGCGGDDDSGAGDESGSAVTIEVLETGGGGPFTATGAAIGAGAICPAGESIITGAMDQATGGTPTPSSDVLLVDVKFTCDDGSGTFTLQATQTGTEEEILDAIELGGPFPTEDWEMISGTGDYEELQGSGTVAGQPIEPGSYTIEVEYMGVVNSD